MSNDSQSVPFTPSSALPARAETFSPLPSLPTLTSALSSQPELDIITSTVRQYVTQRHDYYLSTDIRPKHQSKTMPSSFGVSTLLQALAWERLDELDGVMLSPGSFRVLRDQLLDSPAAKALGVELHNALGWDKEISSRLADPQLLKLVVWSALILEIEPPSSRKPGLIASHDLANSENWGQPYSQVRENIVEGLQWKTRTIEGNRSSAAARLALAILEPLHPEFSIPDVPEDLKYGTLSWVNFAHGVALAEALQPGASPQQTFEQLTVLALERSDNASEDILQTVAATRRLPTLHWAAAHGVIAHQQSAEYSESDLNKAVEALDEHCVLLSRSMEAVLRDPPNRLRMGKQKLKELLGDEFAEIALTIMVPTTREKVHELTLRHPSPYRANAYFYLGDLFIAGFMKNGMDLFKPDFSRFSAYGSELIVPFDIEKLKGVDIPAQFDVAFKAWFEEAQAGYEVLIESLFEDLPVADRVSLAEGEVTVYVMRGETGVNPEDETQQDRADAMGRFGFVLQCSHEGSRFSYEFFPFRAQLIRRTDLPALKVPAKYAQRPAGSKNIRQIGTAVRVDWLAYNENQAPRDGVVSEIIAIEVGRYGPEQTGPVRTLWSPRLKHIARLISQQNMFCDYPRAYSFYRGKTASEFVSENYPPVLRVLEILIPGLSCFNAVQNDKLPGITCALDVGGAILGLPLFRLARGALSVIAQTGRILSVKTFPRFARWAGKTASVGLKNTLPVFRMPQRVNGRMGYPLSGRMTGSAGSSSPTSSSSPLRINTVDEFDEVIAQTRIFGGDDQAMLNTRADLAGGAKIWVRERGDGTRTLIKKDTIDGTYIDLSTNQTVTLVSHYDYRVLKSWAVDEALYPNVTRLRISEIKSSRATLLPDRLASVKEAVETGTYLPPLDVRKAGSGYSVINGNHRLQAALDLGLEEVPVIVKI